MVLFRDGVEHSSLRKHLRSQEHHTVFKAELLSLSLAAELIKAEDHVCMAMIGADSQAAVLTTTHGRGAPGQYLTVGIHQQIVGACASTPALKLRSDGCRVMRGYWGTKGRPGSKEGS